MKILVRILIGKSFQSGPSKDRFASLPLTLNHFRAEVEIISIRKYSMSLLYPIEIRLLTLTLKNDQTYF